MNFNIQQAEAINHGAGACMVVAGAGSGKSTVIVNRIKKLVEDEIYNIIAITFTKNTEKDLKKKLKQLGIENVNTGTFHKVCGRILAMEGIYNQESVKPYEIENLLSKVNPHEKVDMKDVLGFIGFQKSYMIGCDDEFIYKESKYSNKELREFYRAYESFKKEKGLIDLDDLLLITYDILLKNPDKYRCDYLLCDEQQDSNTIQNKLIRALCPSGNIMVVGDYRQCIYGFNGSVPSMFMDFDKEFKDAKVITLDINYRSKKQIVDNANVFIQKYYGKYEHYKDSIPFSKEEGDVDWDAYFNKEEEAVEVVSRIESYIAQGIPANEIAVLFRNNINSQYVENELRMKGIDYFIEKEGGFFQRKEINIILCMLRLIVDNTDNGAFQNLVQVRIQHFKYLKKEFMNGVREVSNSRNVSYLNASVFTQVAPRQKQSLNQFSDAIAKLTRQYQQGVSLESIINNIINIISLNTFLTDNYVGEELEERLQSVENLKKFIRSNTVDSFLKYVYENDDHKKKNDDGKVQMMTIHKSKGLEFEKVIVVGIEDGKFPSSKADILEEARLFYVAITRAKDSLYLSQIGVSNTFMQQYIEY